MEKFIYKNIAYFVCIGCAKHPYTKEKVHRRLGEKKYVLELLEKGIVTPKQLSEFRPMLEFQEKKVVNSIIKFLIKQGKWEDADYISKIHHVEITMYFKGQYWWRKYRGMEDDSSQNPKYSDEGQLWHVPLEKIPLQPDNIRVFLKRGGNIERKKWPMLWQSCPELEKHLVKKHIITRPPNGCRARKYTTAKKYGNAEYAAYFEKECARLRKEEETSEEFFFNILKRTGAETRGRSCPHLKISPQFLHLFLKLLEEGSVSKTLLEACLRNGKFMFQLMMSEGEKKFREEIDREISKNGRYAFFESGPMVENMLFYKFQDIRKTLKYAEVRVTQDFIDRGILTREDMENFWTF